MNRPWMPLYIGDYLADTAHLRAAEHGAYLLLLMHYWRTGGLPDDDAQLARIARMTAAEWRRARPVIEPFFRPGWKHKRVEFELTNASRIVTAGRLGGKASGESRRAKTQKSLENQGTIVQRPFNDRSTIDERLTNDQPTIREALQSQSPSQREEKKETDIRAVAVAPRPNTSEDFENFWKAYPRRDGANPKAPALKVFTAAVKSGADPAAIIGGAERYQKIARAKGQENTQYVAQAVTWLRQSRWADYPASMPIDGLLSDEERTRLWAEMHKGGPNARAN